MLITYTSDVEITFKDALLYVQAAILHPICLLNGYICTLAGIRPTPHSSLAVLWLI